MKLLPFYVKMNETRKIISCWNDDIGSGFASKFNNGLLVLEFNKLLPTRNQLTKPQMTGYL